MSSNIFPKRIVLGVTGGIGAYKSAELIRLLGEQGSEVRVIMTESAKAFITPLTLQALSGFPVYDSLWDGSSSGMPHIDLAKWADCILIAPTTADCMARLAHGFADDLLTTTSLASLAPLVITPAMNQAMWQHAATQHNKKTLEQRGVIFLGPDSGSQACGDNGPGRMLEPEDIIKLLDSHFSKKALLKNIPLLITAGPTQEALDPVRFISNHSSGKMGYALARVASQWGAKVTLISGPVALECPPHVTCIQVRSAENMHHAVMQSISEAAIFISTAAVADYRPVSIATQKIKKTEDELLSLHLIKNPDILLDVSRLKNRPFLVGFAAETENLLDNAQQKLQKKNVDMIIANSADAFYQEDNKGWILTKDKTTELPRLSKITMAEKILEAVTEFYLSIPN